MGLNSRDYYRPSGFGGFSMFPNVIKNLLLINAFVFLVQVMGERIPFGEVTLSHFLNNYFALHPIGSDILGRSYGFQIWQLITYQFMHGGFGHILFNMFALWMFGMELANLMGDKKFLIFYLVSGIGGGLAQALLGPLSLTIGASAAVFGLLLAYGIFFPNRTIYFYFVIPIKARTFVFIMMALEFFMIGSADIVAHLAHFGGAVTAFIFLMLDKSFVFDLKNLINRKMKFDFNFSERKSKNFNFRKPSFSNQKKDVKEAEFYEINSNRNNLEITQEEIDRILDKISKSGYQNLTDKEKKILFEASKQK